MCVQVGLEAKTPVGSSPDDLYRRIAQWQFCMLNLRSEHALSRAVAGKKLARRACLQAGGVEGLGVSRSRTAFVQAGVQSRKRSVAIRSDGGRPLVVGSSVVVDD